MSGCKVHLQDRHGNDLYFANGGEFWYAPAKIITDYRQHLTQIRDMRINEGDVILASFPRSGTFWHYQIILMLLKDSTDYVGHLHTDHLELWPFDKLTSKTFNPRLYTTHIPRYRLLPQQVREKRTKVIYAYRNPKDCWTSFYNFTHNFKMVPTFEGSWSHFFDLMIDCGYWYGDWFDHVLDYEKASKEHPDSVFLSCFETMKQDPVGQITKLNEFLGLNRSRQLCEDIAEKCQFSKLKEANESRFPVLHGDKMWKEGGPKIYRKGEIADWKNWFTVAQSEQLDAVFKTRMSESQLPFFFQ